jgi:hypothetical protein
LIVFRVDALDSFGRSLLFYLLDLCGGEYFSSRYSFSNQLLNVRFGFGDLKESRVAQTKQLFSHVLRNVLDGVDKAVSILLGPAKPIFDPLLEAAVRLPRMNGAVPDVSSALDSFCFPVKNRSLLQHAATLSNF